MHKGLALRLLSVRPVQRVLDAWLARRIRRDAERGRASHGIVPPRPAHYDFRTPEYTSFPTIQSEKWEATRGMSPSFGYNRADREEDYEAPVDLIRSFVDTVSKNGNLLLNVGPRGEDVSIPEPQRARLEALGSWLSRNGDAIHGTRPASQAEAETYDGLPVRFTRKGDTLYAIVLGTPTGETTTVRLPGDQSGELEVTRLCDGRRLVSRTEDGRVQLPMGGAEAAAAHAFSIRVHPGDPGRRSVTG
jgi:alpha-L-fucosidase